MNKKFLSIKENEVTKLKIKEIFNKGINQIPILNTQVM